MTDEDTPGGAGWEYNIVHTDRLGSPAGPQLALIWKRKYSDGSTDWDQISKLGREGWEMVNAFPVESSGTLQYLAFIFKRRISPSAVSARVEPASAGENAAISAEDTADEMKTETMPGSPSEA
jgi:hypothetical protein